MFSAGRGECRWKKEKNRYRRVLQRANRRKQQKNTAKEIEKDRSCDRKESRTGELSCLRWGNQKKNGDYAGRGNLNGGPKSLRTRKLRRGLDREKE